MCRALFASLFLGTIGFLAPELGQASVPPIATELPQFSIHAQGTDWLASSGATTFTRYMAPQSLHSVRPSLTLRFDKLSKKQNLNTYAQKHLTDYPRLGLKVLRHQQVRVGSQPAYLVDLMDAQSNKQLRQVLLAHNKQVAVLTCRAHQKAFKNILPSCHTIIKNFKWTLAGPKVQ